MISLENSIKTCKVDSAWASRVHSDRFLNPSNMVCPVWHGLDNAGRPACENSFASKDAGCHSAHDRVAVENHLRPNYTEFVNLSSSGYAGNLYGGKETSRQHGNFGMDIYASNHHICCNNPHEAPRASACCKPDSRASRISATTGYATASTPVMSSSYMKGIVMPQSEDQTETFSHRYNTARQAQNDRHMQYMQNQYQSSNNRHYFGF